MKLINRLFGFSTKDVYLVELLTFYEKKNVDFKNTKVYYRSTKSFRVAREHYRPNGTYYRDLVSHKKSKDLFDSNNYLGDIVATKTLDLDRKRRIRYSDVKAFNDTTK